MEPFMGLSLLIKTPLIHALKLPIVCKTCRKARLAYAKRRYEITWVGIGCELAVFTIWPPESRRLCTFCSEHEPDP